MKNNIASSSVQIDAKLDILLSRLHSVSQTGNGKFIARCPAHDDKNPSFTIKLGDTGILIKCFAGCDPSSVLSSIGLTFADLFPDRINHRYDGTKPKIPKFSRYELFDSLAYESMILHTALQRLRNGVIFTNAEWRRVDMAMDVIGQFSDEVNAR